LPAPLKPRQHSALQILYYYYYYYRVYAPRDARKRQIAAKRLLRCRQNFSKSLMVSMAVSKLGCSELFFVEPGVKVDGRYYWDMLLKQQMLPDMRRIAGDMFVFQQDSVPAHSARDCPAPAAADTAVHLTRSVAAQQP